MLKNKKGQVMLWVILAIVLVGSMILFFTLERDIRISVQESLDPGRFIEECAREGVKNAVDLMLPQGGFVNPGNTKTYESVEIEYLCLNEGNYLPCINQHPMLLNEMRLEIEDFVTPRVDDCFLEFKQESEKRKSSVTYGDLEVEVTFGPSRIYLDVKRDVNIKRNGDSVDYESFDVEVVSPMYDLANVAIEIASSEAEFCSFEYLGYAVLHPEFDIRKFTMSDSTKIYTIEDVVSGKEMNIAIRGCAVPAGI